VAVRGEGSEALCIVCACQPLTVLSGLVVGSL
jgi:hypothetical protein